MRIGIVTENIRPSKQFIDCALRRGHQLVNIVPSQCDLVFNAEMLGIASSSPDATSSLPDLVLTRIPSGTSTRSLNVARQLEGMGVRCINSSSAIESSRNKIRCYTSLGAHHLPFPRTVLINAHSSYAQRVQKFDRLVSLLPQAPWVVKLPSGSKGQGVMLVESLAALRALLDTFAKLNQEVLVQEFISDARLGDYRVLVVGGKAVAAVKRTCPPNEFRANGALGARGSVAELDSRLCWLAEQAAIVFNLEIAGVDLVRNGDDYLIVEANSCPGIHGMQRMMDAATPIGEEKVHIASLLVDHFEHARGG